MVEKPSHSQPKQRRRVGRCRGSLLLDQCIPGDAVLDGVYFNAAAERDGWRLARQADRSWWPGIEPPACLGQYRRFYIGQSPRSAATARLASRSARNGAGIARLFYKNYRKIDGSPQISMRSVPLPCSQVQFRRPRHFCRDQLPRPYLDPGSEASDVCRGRSAGCAVGSVLCRRP
jgi:hypothetical protein